MRLGGIAILCGLVVFILTGCAQYQAQQQAQAADQAQAQAASDDAQCQSYGVSPGSPGYVHRRRFARRPEDCAAPRPFNVRFTPPIATFDPSAVSSFTVDGDGRNGSLPSP